LCLTLLHGTLSCNSTPEKITVPVKKANSTSPFYDFKAIDIDGVEQSLSQYAGHVCIVVNVASK